MLFVDHDEEDKDDIAEGAVQLFNQNSKMRKGTGQPFLKKQYFSPTLKNGELIIMGASCYLQ